MVCFRNGAYNERSHRRHGRVQEENGAQRHSPSSSENRVLPSCLNISNMPKAVREMRAQSSIHKHPRMNLPLDSPKLAFAATGSVNAEPTRTGDECQKEGVVSPTDRIAHPRTAGGAQQLIECQQRVLEQTGSLLTNSDPTCRCSGLTRGSGTCVVGGGSRTRSSTSAGPARP